MIERTNRQQYLWSTNRQISRKPTLRRRERPERRKQWKQRAQGSLFGVVNHGGSVWKAFATGNLNSKDGPPAISLVNENSGRNAVALGHLLKHGHFRDATTFGMLLSWLPPRGKIRTFASDSKVPSYNPDIFSLLLLPSKRGLSHIYNLPLSFWGARYARWLVSTIWSFLFSSSRQ